MRHPLLIVYEKPIVSPSFTVQSEQEIANRTATKAIGEMKSDRVSKKLKGKLVRTANVTPRLP
jgi:hypothetical protein